VLNVIVGAGSDELSRRGLWELHVRMNRLRVTHRLLHQLFICLGMEVRAIRRGAFDSPHVFAPPFREYMNEPN
jgi:hypothetical protein